MIPGTSIHVHTTYCDGKNTPSELAEEALRLGLRVLGFSGHSPSDFADTSGMTPEGMEAYILEVSALKKRYEGRLEIALGLEQDYFSPIDQSRFDYVIGSVHSVKGGGGQYVVDGAAEKFRACADELFGGEGLGAALLYYDTYKAMIQSLRPTVAGHLDLLTKVNRGLFDENSPVYVRAALGAAECAWQAGAVIEINTGAMARGYMKTPYPSPFILKQLARWKAPVTITSDCHRKEFLCHYYAESLHLMKECGFSELHEWQGGAFIPIPIP